jgi:hypothetical protein
MLDREALDESVGNRGRERFQQMARLAGHLAHGRRYLAVVDCICKHVVDTAFADFELDVVEKELATDALLLSRTVIPEELQPAELDLHPTTACAARKASTCSRTSWARRIVAPRS